MQRVMQSLPQRRVSHVTWPSLQNTCLLRSWLQRHDTLQTLGPDDQDSSGTSYTDQDAASPVTLQASVSPPMAGDQCPVSRGHLSPVSPVMMQYQAWLAQSADHIPAAGPSQLITTGSMLHVSQIFREPNDNYNTCKSNTDRQRGQLII